MALIAAASTPAKYYAYLLRKALTSSNETALTNVCATHDTETCPTLQEIEEAYNEGDHALRADIEDKCGGKFKKALLMWLEPAMF